MTCDTTTRRIDRFYGYSKALNYMHIPISFSDHCMSPGILVNGNSQAKWGPGAWKLNSNLINDSNIRIVDNLWKTFQGLDRKQGDILTWWDKMKERIKRFYTVKGIMNSKATKYDIEKKTTEIQNIMRNFNNEDLENFERYRILKQEIHEYEKMKVNQFRIQHKIEKINEEMEIPDKSFFNKHLDTKQKSQMTMIKSDDDVLIKDPNAILNRIHEYYSNIWNDNVEVTNRNKEDYLESIEIINHNNFDEDGNDDRLDHIITKVELNRAQKSQVKKEKSPGPDGLTYEFYDNHWDTVNDDLLTVLNTAYVEERLPDSMYESYIKLIPKQGDLTNLKNWRPIALLNNDYKILAKVIYNKIINFFNNRTSPNQKAVFPKRNIMDIHFNTSSVISYIKQKKLEAAILKIDLEKAFDNVNHDFMFKVLKKFELPDSLIKWIEIIYKKPTCQILVNGAFTSIIEILKGVRQGCPLSMLLFGLIIDILIKKVTANCQIKGIPFGKMTS